ncbi:Lin0512 family protein [Neobacillus bataviensis]|uniref:Lin0512 family protein n=1 Tax=Neobacillus bataviensis TaxID=220685 RepID=UPI00031880E2|nr:Lin0512 family protein [Neobacillus bataviensis]
MFIETGMGIDVQVQNITHAVVRAVKEPYKFKIENNPPLSRRVDYLLTNQYLLSY